VPRRRSQRRKEWQAEKRKKNVKKEEEEKEKQEEKIHRNRAVPSIHAIRIWFRNFEATGSPLRKKGFGVTAAVRVAIESSPHRAARRHSAPLWLSEASVRRILHKDLHFCPYRIEATHAVHERYYVNIVKRIAVEMLQRVMGDVRRSWRVSRAEWWSSECCYFRKEGFLFAMR
jgi:hypothetical protein